MIFRWRAEPLDEILLHTHTNVLLQCNLMCTTFLELSLLTTLHIVMPAMLRQASLSVPDLGSALDFGDENFLPSPLSPSFMTSLFKRSQYPQMTHVQ